MARTWTGESWCCNVDDDGVYGTLVGTNPLHVDFRESLERWLTDPDTAAWVNEHFAGGTQEQMRAEVVATLLRLGRAVPEVLAARVPLPRVPAEVPVVPSPVLPPGDDGALVVARLVAAVAGVVAPPAVACADTWQWSAPDRVENHAPLTQEARLGSVHLVRRVDEAAQPGGAFTVDCVDVYALHLPAGVVVQARWDGASGLQVDVRAPSSAETAVRRLVGAQHLRFFSLD